MNDSDDTRMVFGIPYSQMAFALQPGRTNIDQHEKLTVLRRLLKAECSNVKIKIYLLP
jgi:hypothetical protein